MRPGPLRRTTRYSSRPLMRLRRIRQHATRERIPTWLRRLVYERDGWRCIATRFDPEHRCQPPLTVDHVPERGMNAYGKKAPTNRWHLVAACFGANDSIGWCNTHREEERAWLEALYGPGPYPQEPERKAEVAS